MAKLVSMKKAVSMKLTEIEICARRAAKRNAQIVALTHARAVDLDEIYLLTREAMGLQAQTMKVCYELIDMAADMKAANTAITQRVAQKAKTK